MHEFPVELVTALDVPGPRYTSYPTADRFVDAFDDQAYSQVLRQRATGAAPSAATPLWVYVHLPFCESLCFYCACNKVISRHHERAAPYLQAVLTELSLHADILGNGVPAAQLHLGGGTPTFLSDEELSTLMTALRATFHFTHDAELAIEVDPRTASVQRLAHLASLGFNRLSLGVQDFDPTVQKAVNRVQSEASVSDLVVAARALGMSSVNLDLIYGLPKQTPTSFAQTVHKVCELRPDRIALYAYAHLPARFKPQRRISDADLPAPDQRLLMLGQAIQAFLEAGYVYIGMDHFALPGDTLAVAKRQGRLHRNFQGYSTRPDSDLIGLGVSAIGRVGATYSQNAKTLPEYLDAVSHGRFAVVRGLALTRDDLLRRSVIMAIMCQGRVDFESIELSHLVVVKTYFKAELVRLVGLVDAGLIEMDDEHIELTPRGWFFVRAVAMVFDRHLQADVMRERFSKVI